MGTMNINRNIDLALWELAKRSGKEYLDTADASIIAKEAHDVLVLDSITMCNALIEERIRKIRGYREQLSRLLQQPQVEQRSPEWHDMRRNRLTASDTATSIGRGKFETRKNLLKKKAFPDLVPFVSSPIMKWGTMLEPVANRCYRQRNGDILIHEFGLVPHPTVDHYGASPDGISELGIMLEFKCPPKRKMDGTIPEQYEIQMQGQMAVCGLHECDYVECGIDSIEDAETYLATIDPESRTDHGIVLEYCDNTVMSYDYSPEYLTPSEAWKWAQERIKNEVRHLVRITPWRIREYFAHRVYFDPERWEKIMNEVAVFWSEVEEMRRMGPGTLAAERATRKRERMNKIIEFIDDGSDDDSEPA